MRWVSRYCGRYCFISVGENPGPRLSNSTIFRRGRGRGRERERERGTWRALQWQKWALPGAMARQGKARKKRSWSDAPGQANYNRNTRKGAVDVAHGKVLIQVLEESILFLPLGGMGFINGPPGAPGPPAIPQMDTVRNTVRLGRSRSRGSL